MKNGISLWDSQIWNNFEVPIFLCDANGRIIEYNNAFGAEIISKEDASKELTLEKLFKIPDWKSKLAKNIKIEDENIKILKTGICRKMSLYPLQSESKIYEGYITKKIEEFKLDDIAFAKEKLQNFKIRKINTKTNIASITYGKKGYLIGENSQFKHLTGYESSDLKKFSILDFISQRDKQKVLNYHEDLLKSAEKKAIQFQFKIKNGNYLDLEINCVKILECKKQNKLIFVSYIKDISQEKHFIRELKEAKKEAEKANEMKSSLFYNVSHELRTPINAITGFAELIKHSDSIERNQRYSDKIIGGAENLLKLINQLLDLSKMQSKRLSLETHNFKFKILIKKIITKYKKKCNSKNIEFKSELDEKLPDNILGDTLRIKQIIELLLDNALKFTNKGFIKLSVKEYYDFEDYVIIKIIIQDTGVGIPPKKLKQIFNSFIQADSGSTRKFGGTGIGITIVKRLVDMMEGELDIKSKENHGTVVEVEIPFEKPEDIDETNSFMITSNDDSEEYNSSEKSGKILLVEDYKVNLDLAKEHLRSAGHQISTALNGKEAVKSANKEKFDIILMDLQMPVMDGYEATKNIRNSTKSLNSDTPIIALTAHADSETYTKCQKASMNGILTKPLRRNSFLNSINEILVKGHLDKKNIKSPKKSKNSKPINYSEALYDFGKDKTVLNNIIDRFIKNLETQLPQIEKYLEKGEIEQLRNEIHKIKGGSGNLYADPLFRISKKINEDIKNNKLDDLESSIKTFSKRISEFKDYFYKIKDKE